MSKRVVLLGDSITQGLGSKKINFTEELQNLLGKNYLVDNMALTGTTIYYVEKIMENILEKKPEYVVIIYGNVDAQIRPSRKGRIFMHLPKRFQGNGMLMPRPFYSHKFFEKFGQKVENIARLFFSKLIYTIDGTEQWVDLESFSVIYKKIVKILKEKEINIIACSTVFIDENKFPGSLEQYELFNLNIRKIAEEEMIEYIDLYSELKKAVSSEKWDKFYCFDHFHPNEGGYKIIADQISKVIIQ